MKKRRLVIIIFAIALVLLVLPIKFSQSLRDYSWLILKPAGISFKKTIGRSFTFIKNAAHLRQIINQNSDLVSENLQLQSQVALLLEVQNENEILKKELGFMQTQDLTTTTAAAIIGVSSDYLKSLVIDKGKVSGIESGDAVISQGVLIGTVSQVREQTSDVTLITDYNSLVPVVLQDSRGTGLLRGGLGGLTVEDIPLNINIKKGENVVTSGLGGQIPAGILVSTVSDIISKQGEIFQKITSSSSIDFYRLEVVFILKK